LPRIISFRDVTYGVLGVGNIFLAQVVQNCCGMAQLDWHAIYDRIGMVLPTFRSFMTNPFDCKAQRSATAIVSRTL
jgi:hypothetical protein